MRGFRLGLPALCAVAAALRLVAAIAMGDEIVPLPGIHDQLSYDALARRVAAGEGFSFDRDWWPLTRAGEPTAHWSFLYTGFLAAVYSIAGPHPLAARAIQAILAGVLLTWGAFRLGGALFGPGASRWAAALVAIYPYFVYYGAALMTEAFTIAAVVWLLAMVVEQTDPPLHGAESCGERTRFGARSPGEQRRGGAMPSRAPETGAALDWVLVGALLGAIALLRQVALVPAVLALGWVVVRRRARASTLGALLALAVTLAMVLPVTWRNHRVFGRVVPINTNAGYALFWANHPVHGDNFQSILPTDGPSYVDLVPPALRGLDEAALEDALFARGVGFVIEDPARFLRLSASRIDDYFLFWPRPTSGRASNVARVLSFGLALPFMAAGLVASRRRWRACMPCYLFVAAYSLIHLLSWALVRYRLPVDAVLLVFAGLALDRLGARLAAVRRAPRIAAA